jgi:peptide/nickel transport system permease protein
MTTPSPPGADPAALLPDPSLVKPSSSTAIVSPELLRRKRLRLLFRSGTFLTGLTLVGIWVICAIFGDWIAPYDPAGSPADILNKNMPPSAEHWLGTDQLGRDVLSRIIAGARSILLIAPAATLLGTVLGTGLGLVTGYFRGVVDDVLSRVIDAFLSIPLVITGLIALTALGPSTIGVIVVIGLVFTPVISRTVRAAVLAERELEYVAAARLRRERSPHIMFFEILPNVMGPILVEFTVRLGYAIFTIATLSFLGFGVEPSSPDWGLTIFQHYALLNGGIWWPVLFPATAIASLVVGVNLLSDGIAGVFEN